MSGAPRVPWWLQPGTETCPFCEAGYPFGAGYYCIDCDRPICPVCVVEIHASRKVYCPQCLPSGGH